MEQSVTVRDLTEQVKAFCEERDWDQFHCAKNLAIGLVTEASELLDHFRFESDADSDVLAKDLTQREPIVEELADLLFLLLRFAQHFNINLEEALRSKIKKNALKYPADLAKGSGRKYNRLATRRGDTKSP